MKVNDFFCGCGGMAIGFMNAGFEISGAWDFDKYAVESYRANIGNHVKQIDVTKMTAEDVPKADVWAFGFPCQDLSVAGKQAGIYKGKKSKLFFEIMRLLDETPDDEKPKMLLAENVKGLKPYLSVLEVEYKKRGYTAHIQLFNSKYWNVAQSRERYFIVGTRDADNLVFKFPVEQKNNIPKLSEFLDKHVFEKYYISDEKAQTIIEQVLKRIAEVNGVHATVTPNRSNKRQNGRRAKEDNEPMFTLAAQDIHGIICRESELLNPNDTSKTSRVSGKGSLSKKHNYEYLIEPQMKVVGMLDISSYKHNRRVNSSEGLSPTVTAVTGGTHHVKIFDYSCCRVRKLTPTEYGRLQAFPMDTWQQVVSNSQAYRQFGNAVTTTVVKAIAERIFKCIKRSNNKKFMVQCAIQDFIEQEQLKLM